MVSGQKIPGVSIRFDRSSPHLYASDNVFRRVRCYRFRQIEVESHRTCGLERWRDQYLRIGWIRAVDKAQAVDRRIRAARARRGVHERVPAGFEVIVATTAGSPLSRRDTGRADGAADGDGLRDRVCRGG